MSLMPLAGMFLFGGDKKKKKRLEEEKKYRERIKRMYEEASRKYGIPKEKLEKILLFGIYNGGHVKILKKAIGMPEKKILDVLDANYTIPNRHIYIIPSRQKNGMKIQGNHTLRILHRSTPFWQ